MADTSTSELDLRAILGVLWRRKWSILLIVALTTGSALFFSYRRTAVYSSTAEVQVTPLTGSQILTANPYWTLANMDNEIHVVQSTAVAVLADKAMEGRAGSGTLSVEVPTNTQILQIGYSHADPETARDGAQAFANAYLTYRTRVAVDAYAQARQAIQTQIVELRSDLEVAQAALEVAPAGSSDETVAANQVDHALESARGPEHPGRVAGRARHHARHADPAGRGPDVAIEPGPPPGRGPGLRRRTGARGGVRVHARADGRPDPRRGPARCRRRSAGSGRRAEGLGLAQAEPDEARHDLGVREPGRRGLPLASDEPAVHLARRQHAGHRGDEPPGGRGQDHDGRQPRRHARAHGQARRGALGRSAQASAAPVLRPGQRGRALIHPGGSGGRSPTLPGGWKVSTHFAW